MKDKIIFLIIGILIGAIIATAGFLIYSNNVEQDSNQPEMMQMNKNGEMGEQPENGEMGDPPEKPSGDESEEPPADTDNLNENVNS